MDTNRFRYKEIIKLALEEDLYPHGDITSVLLINPQSKSSARLLAKQAGVLACSTIVPVILNESIEIINRYHALNYPANCFTIEALLVDGAEFVAGEELFRISGPSILLLTAERTLLNFLQRLSGVASAARRLVRKLPPQVHLLDTRKTMPGMRVLEKLAFKQAGGRNHRLNLSDMVLIKENHLSLGALGLIEAISQTRVQLDATKKSNIQIECEVNQDFLAIPGALESLMASPVNTIMLDNFSPPELMSLIPRVREMNPRIQIELSGGINESNIVAYANTEPDYISTGSVFTQATNIDISMLMIPENP